MSGQVTGEASRVCASVASPCVLYFHREYNIPTNGAPTPILSGSTRDWRIRIVHLAQLFIARSARSKGILHSALVAKYAVGVCAVTFMPFLVCL